MKITGYPFSRDARWRMVALRLGVILGLYVVLRYFLVPHDPRFIGGGLVTFLLMDLAFPITLFVPLLGIVLVVMVVFWRWKKDLFPGFSHAVNMTVAPMAVVLALILINEINNPLWR